MAEQSSSDNQEILDTASFLAVFNDSPSGTAFRLMDGILDDPSEPIVMVSTYAGANAVDFIEILGPRHREHGIASFGTPESPVPQAQIVIRYPDDDRWSFDAEHPDYRVKRILIESPDGLLQAASLLKTTNGFDIIDCWLVKDGR